MEDKELLKKALPMYLNHGLKCQTRHGILELDCIDNKASGGYSYWFNSKNKFNVKAIRLLNCSAHGYRYSEIKPILKPLSDLTKEILNKFNFIRVPQVGDDVGKYSYEFSLYCFENHYDFFFLIEKGLAISYKELNK